MVEYETKGRIVRGPFIKSEDNAVKLFDILDINGAVQAIFKYTHPSCIAKGNLTIKPIEFSYSIEYFDDEPFERTRISEPFKNVEIEIEPSRILDKKKKLGLNERGYKFGGFEYHQRPYETGIHILSDKSKKETIAGMSAKADYNSLYIFKSAMAKLGFTDLTEKTIKHTIIDFKEILKP